VRGVSISHPDRVLFPADGLTKLDLARYYDAVAPAMVPHLAGRPLTLFHCPQGIGGECRFMKHSKVWALPALRRVRIQEKTKAGEYLVAESPEALVSLAQMDIVELHTWNATVDALETPDRLVFDLDPGPRVAWRAVVEAARLVRGVLRGLGLEPFLKTTGGRGLHLVVPLVPRAGWGPCLDFARAVAEALAHHEPRRFTAAFAKRGREGKILVDYLRNNRTNTSVAAFSARARDGAPVSVPIAWDELTPAFDPGRLTIRTVPRRLARPGADPWAGYAAAARPLDAAATPGAGAGEARP
jgi:bifunctional non-homologous end joining protein LigD